MVEASTLLGFLVLNHHKAVQNRKLHNLKDVLQITSEKCGVDMKPTESMCI